jgi:uncharacterized membrane protein
MMGKTCHWLAALSLIGLIFLSLAWELWLAPLRPGGSMLVLKAVLLLAPLFGILRGRLYTFQWSSMFILLFFTEGVMRAWAERGLSQHLAWVEIMLSTLFFAAVIGFVRCARAAAYPSSKSSAPSAR